MMLSQAFSGEGYNRAESISGYGNERHCIYSCARTYLFTYVPTFRSFSASLEVDYVFSDQASGREADEKNP